MTNDIFTLAKKHGVMIEIHYLGFMDAYSIRVQKKGYENEKRIMDIDVFDYKDVDMCKYIETMIRELELYIEKKEKKDEEDTNIV